MYQKDFILRMIEMLGDLIKGILGLIKKGDLKQASQTLENAYYDFLKEEAGFFRNIPKEKLSDKLIKEHNYTRGHLEILAGLFYAEAELLYAGGSCCESLEYYEKALLLYKFGDKELQIFSFDNQSKIALIQHRIDELKNKHFSL